MKTSFIFVAVALALLLHEARSQTCSYEAEFLCDVVGIFTCVKEELNEASTCLARQFTAQHNAQQIQLNTHAEAINSLAMMQAMMKDDLKCLNAGGQMCPVDRKCYQNLGRKRHSSAVTQCERLPGGSLLAAVPTDSSIVYNCMDLNAGDDAWLADFDDSDGCNMFTAPSTTGTENCNNNNFAVCEISL